MLDKIIEKVRPKLTDEQKKVRKLLRYSQKNLESGKWNWIRRDYVRSLFSRKYRKADYSVCAIGALQVADVLLNGSPKAKKLLKEAGYIAAVGRSEYYEKAVWALANAIKRDHGRAPSDNFAAAEQVVTTYNDSKQSSRKKIIKAFEDAWNSIKPGQ